MNTILFRVIDYTDKESYHIVKFYNGVPKSSDVMNDIYKNAENLRLSLTLQDIVLYYNNGVQFSFLYDELIKSNKLFDVGDIGVYYVDIIYLPVVYKNITDGVYFETALKPSWEVYLEEVLNRKINNILNKLVRGFK